MAEIVSRQAAKIAAGTKMAPAEAYGKQRVVVLTTPATHAAALNDTIGSGITLPVGTRILASSFVSCAAGAASSTLSIGLRDPVSKTAIASAGIASGVALTTASSRLEANTGTLIANGAEYVTTAVSEIYATFTGAAPTANQQVRIEVAVATTD